MTDEEKAEEYIASKTKEWTDGAYDFTLEEVRTMLIEFAKELVEENNKLLDVINNQDVKIADLEKQIEKMKNCRNCNFDGGLVCLCETICKNKDKWELEE